MIAWGLLIPLLIYFLGPQLQTYLPPDADADEAGWDLANAVWRYIVRPIAVGGMMVGTAYTLFRMRKNLVAGLAKRVPGTARRGAGAESLGRTERYMSSQRGASAASASRFVADDACSTRTSRAGDRRGIAAAFVMLIVGFFFATVSGYLVGVIGSSNNPISGLTLSTLIIAALLMVALGVSGTSGVVAVLGVAAVVCVSSAVAGELLQDFKVGYILGGTPRNIQIAELIAVVVASLVMYFPLMMLHQGNINTGGIGFGDQALSAPQAGLMASLAQGIVGGDMAWPLVIAGILMGIAHDHDSGSRARCWSPSACTCRSRPLRDLRRRHDPLDHRCNGAPGAIERSPEGADGECRRAGGFRHDRRRSACRDRHRMVQLQGVADSRNLP